MFLDFPNDVFLGRFVSHFSHLYFIHLIKCNTHTHTQALCRNSLGRFKIANTNISVEVWYCKLNSIQGSKQTQAACVMRMPHAAFCKNLLMSNNRSQREVIRLEKVSCNMPESSKCLPDCIRKNLLNNIQYSAHFQVQAFILDAYKLMLKEILSVTAAPLCLSVSVSLKPSKKPSLL